jgi:ribosomal-protein-alanine N-acetyltransferase
MYTLNINKEYRGGGEVSFRLETNRLFIRPFLRRDARALHKIFGDVRVMERIPSGPSRTLEETQRRLDKIMEWQEQYGFSLWALEHKDDGTLIGDCGLIPVEGHGPEIELSYDIAYKFWGRGYATEAAQACLRYGFEKLKLNRIIALTYADHIASLRVMHKIGMTYEKSVHLYDRDLVQYSISAKRNED